MATLPTRPTQNNDSYESHTDSIGTEQSVRPRATIAEVAELSGVGLSTVSRVIRGAPNVSENTRQKVEAAIRETGYRVDNVARSLRNNENLDLVALVVPDIGDPYFGEIYIRMQEAALSRGESLLVGCHIENYALQREILRHMAMNRPSSIILVPAPGTTTEDVASIQARGIHVVILDRPVAGVQVDAVLAENESAAELLVDKFTYSAGEKVAIVSMPTTIWTQQRRFEATLRALRERGIEPAIVIEEPALTAPMGEAFAPIFAMEVDTVLSMSIPPAMGILRMEKQVASAPVRLGCFDRHPWFELVREGIASVYQDPEEVVHQVGYLLKRRRENPRATTITSVISFRADGHDVASQ